MRRTGIRYKCFATIASAMSFLVFAVPILAQQEDLMAGRIAGEQSASANVNKTTWMLIGCIGGLLGVIIAYVYEPSPPAVQLLGKSPEYVAAFTDAYKAAGKNVQTKNAWLGCFIGTGISTALYILGAVAAASSAD